MTMALGSDLDTLPLHLELIRGAMLRLPIELAGDAHGVVGYCRTIHDDLVTIDCIWSGQLFDLSDWRERAETCVGRTARIEGAMIGVARVRMVNARDESVAPAFIPAWSFDLRMGGVRIASAGGSKAIRLAADDTPRPIPEELLGRLRGSFRGVGACTATATSRIRIHTCDAADIAMASEPVLRVDLVVRALVSAR
jgi:hypothetical protein